MRAYNFILLFVSIFNNITVSGQKLESYKFIEGKVYLSWQPSNSEIAFAEKQIRDKFLTKESYEIKTTLLELCYLDTVYGKVSTHLLLFKSNDEAKPYLNFKKVYFSHSKDSLLKIESYLFDPFSPKSKRIISIYGLSIDSKLNDSIYQSICQLQIKEMGNIIATHNQSMFYPIDKYKVYSDYTVYRNRANEKLFFLSFYNPELDFSQPRFDNFVILYNITSKAQVAIFPEFGIN